MVKFSYNESVNNISGCSVSPSAHFTPGDDLPTTSKDNVLEMEVPSVSKTEGLHEKHRIPTSSRAALVKNPKDSPTTSKDNQVLEREEDPPFVKKPKGPFTEYHIPKSSETNLVEKHIGKNLPRKRNKWHTKKKMSKRGVLDD